MSNSNGEEQMGSLCDLEGEVERVLKLNLSAPELRDKHSSFVLQTLQKLNDQIHIIIDEAGDYPENPIPALVWKNGVTCGGLASALTQHTASLSGSE